MNVKVYCKPDCVQCEYTKKKLDEFHIAHTDFDITQDPFAFSTVQATGRTQMPYVVAGDQTWHGFQYDKLRGLNPIDHAYVRG
jgi:glutaredoxin-like protein NrdH